MVDRSSTANLVGLSPPFDRLIDDIDERPAGTIRRVVVTVNGPGEIAAWLYPFGMALKRRRPHYKLCVAVVPCTFSSGAELDVVRSYPFVDAVCSARQSVDMILRGRLPPGFDKPMPGVLLHLGGEILLSYLLSKRLRLPSFAYVEGKSALQTAFDAVFRSGLDTRTQESADNIGELIVDAARLRYPKRRRTMDGIRRIGLYPGSRDYLVSYMLPFFAAVADHVAAKHADVEWMLAKADFLPDAYLHDIPRVERERPLEGVDLCFETEGDERCLVTPKGTRIAVRSPTEVATQADLALTIPGTTTGELAALGIPMVVTLPTWRGETAPLPGLAGHLDRIPLLGRLAKRGVAHLYLWSIGNLAHPNRRSGRQVVPELVGHISASDVGDVVGKMLGSDLAPVTEDLRSVMGSPGAADRIVDRLVARMERKEESAAVPELARP
jgi:lipid-A-disaccharide synthase